MKAAVPWLPPPSDDDAEAALRWIVLSWLKRWIVEPANIRITDAASGTSETVVAETGDRVALALAACDGRATVTNPRDYAILSEIGDEMIADLIDEIGERRDFEGRCYRVGDSSENWRIRLTVDETQLVHARKALSGARRPVSLGRLADALASECVQLGCHLGSATLNVAELTALAVGDVIVLDRALTTPVPLTVAGALPLAGLARIESGPDAVRITVTESIDLQGRN